MPPPPSSSSQEMDKFSECFKDPDFCKMMSEYMDEISDPKHRQEQEEYIRQLEGENKVRREW